MARVCFVADDLTGASDVLAQAHRLGLTATLLIGEPGSAGDADLIGDEQVVGVATPARAQSGGTQRKTIQEAVRRVLAFAPDLLLYKVCSTFDSSPTTGSIAAALKVLAQHDSDHGAIPVIPAQPAFGRYTLFSHHFGRAGDEVYRLDRHPVMSRHPATPMRESDLRLILSEQFRGEAAIPGLHLPDLVGPDSDAAWERHRTSASPAFVVDAIEDEHLKRVAGRLLEQQKKPAMVVGSGGIMTGIGLALGGEAEEAPSERFSHGPVLAVSASASSTTATQIDHAVQQGWAEIPLPGEVWDSGLPDELVDQVCDVLGRGTNVVVHTARGPDDPRLRHGFLDPAAVGAVLAKVVSVASRRGLTRDVAVLGGDTSTLTLLALGVRTLRVAELFVVGAPVCRTDDQSLLAGCRVLLKGGQVGGVDVLSAFAGRRSASNDIGNSHTKGIQPS